MVQTLQWVSVDYVKPTDLSAVVSPNIAARSFKLGFQLHLLQITDLNGQILCQYNQPNCKIAHVY